MRDTLKILREEFKELIQDTEYLRTHVEMQLKVLEDLTAVVKDLKNRVSNIEDEVLNL